MLLSILECHWMLCNVIEVLWNVTEMLLNVVECCGMLLKWYGMLLYVMQCYWMFWNVTECSGMLCNVIEILWDVTEMFWKWKRNRKGWEWEEMENKGLNWLKQRELRRLKSREGGRKIKKNIGLKGFEWRERRHMNKDKKK